MTNKEYVLSVYPNAYYVDKGFSYSKSVIWYFKEGSGTYCLGTGIDEERCWEDAWKWIKTDMLKKFES